MIRINQLKRTAHPAKSQSARSGSGALATALLANSAILGVSSL